MAAGHYEEQDEDEKAMERQARENLSLNEEYNQNVRRGGDSYREGKRLSRAVAVVVAKLFNDTIDFPLRDLRHGILGGIEICSIPEIDYRIFCNKFAPITSRFCNCCTNPQNPSDNTQKPVQPLSVDGGERSGRTKQHGFIIFYPPLMKPNPLDGCYEKRIK